MSNSDEIIKEEIEKVLEEIKELYEKSGKKTTGKFAKDLKSTYSPNKATIEGHVYLAGRLAGRMPPVKELEKWVVAKGIASANSKRARGIAWAISKKIAERGTNKDNHLDPYKTVLTPQRIDSIIQKVSQFNIGLFVDTIQTELKILQTTFRNGN